MSFGSLSDYARHINASPAYVSKLKKDGRLVLKDDGGKQVVDFELSDRLVRNTTDLGRAANGRNSRSEGDSSSAVQPLSEGGRVDVVFRKAQAQERAYSAKIEELKYREMAGELIRVEAVRTAIARAASSARDALQQIPARLSPVLAAETDAAKVHALLEGEIHGALAQLTGLAIKSASSSAGAIG